MVPSDWLPLGPVVELPEVGPRSGVGLEALTAATRVLLEGRGIVVFDPPIAAGDPAGDFARYLTFQETQADGQAVHHVVFVVAAPWSPDRADRFIEAFYLMQASTPAEVGPPWFHFVAPEPLPAGVAYLFGNTWSGALEARLYAALAEPVADPSDPSPYVAAVRTIFGEVGVETTPGEHGVVELERLLAALPRSRSGESAYRPVATLLAIGLVFSDQLRHRHRSLDWVAGDTALARFYALAVRGHEGLFLRPIDYVFDAYDSDAVAPLGAYEELIRVRLRQLGSDE